MSGGAITSYQPIKLNDCKFISNSAGTGHHSSGYGGGISLYSSGDTIFSGILFIEGCEFTKNVAWTGGAIYATSSTSNINRIYIMKSIFSGNRTFDIGGALNISQQNDTIISNSIIAGNRGKTSGGLLVKGPSQISNCTIVGDSSILKTSVSYFGYPANIRNCIIADYGVLNLPNATVAFSNVWGGFAGEGNIDVDSCFVKPGYWADANDSNIIREANDINAVWINGDYHLRIDSPCIDIGDPNFVSGTTDLDDNPRAVDGDRYGSAVIDMGAYEYQNTAPGADAGPNQAVYAWIDGIAEVNLDGSGSYDEDGDKLTYQWRWLIDSNDCEINGCNPKIKLPVGQHTLELVVNDGSEDSEPNYVEITIVEPIKGTLMVTPQIINGRSEQKRVMTMLRLPEGITKDQIDSNSTLLLYPGEVEAIKQLILPYYANGTRRVNIFAFFDRYEIPETIRGIGPAQIYVVGRLKTGQYFYGSDTMRIIIPRLPVVKM